MRLLLLSFVVASADECSCWKGFKPGIGIPGIGSLSCWAPQSCKEKCSAIYTEECHFRALCTLSEGGGHHCDCSMCQGPTKEYTEFEKHCAQGACEEGESCYYHGCHFEGSSSVCSGDMSSGKECRCDFPKVRDQTGTCAPCPGDKQPKFDQKRQAFYCDKSLDSGEF
eukprot:CAMPEP_0197661008 /NCGR_PEP_ID=MMETSP1338-20131121/51193_1 /TAXON_ID=43686 ORGANISM="Pelagodinium beii, Strain RCC1491" /NCGR_SAMPLE_ID=MMETSP1338 /ASSEMBLY_ACC=CAM_ASM_000754 /LENGTH=167 /DNA_ID=CAMNT_0043238473 /DNA_START=42 /DNA_END=542 /DNA_ORIENTATION=-